MFNCPLVCYSVTADFIIRDFRWHLWIQTMQPLHFPHYFHTFSKRLIHSARCLLCEILALGNCHPFNDFTTVLTCQGMEQRSTCSCVGVWYLDVPLLPKLKGVPLNRPIFVLEAKQRELFCLLDFFCHFSCFFKGLMTSSLHPISWDTLHVENRKWIWTFCGCLSLEKNKDLNLFACSPGEKPDATV